MNHPVISRVPLKNPNMANSSSSSHLKRPYVMSCLLRDFIRACNLDSRLAMYGYQAESRSMEEAFLAKVHSGDLLDSSKLDILPTGSTFEGLSLPDSSMYEGKIYSTKRHQADMDFMFVDKTKLVMDRVKGGLLPTWASSTEGGGSLQSPWAYLHYGDTHSGYVRLVPSNSPGRLDTARPQSPNTPQSLFTKPNSKDSQLFVSADLYKTQAKKEQYLREVYSAVKGNAIKLNNPETELKHSGPYEHGPAVTTTVMGSVDSWETEVDVVLALSVTVWPEAAAEWVTRSRQHHWPDPSLVTSIVSNGCHVVPVAHSNSPCPELEWRLSFSATEKRLAHSLSAIQRQCYLLVKLLYNHELKHHGAIASYHIKTALFWVCENTAKEFWSEDNLIHCFNLVLDTLLDFLRRRNIPNYFVRSNNMIDHVPEPLLRQLSGDIEKFREKPFDGLLPYQVTYNIGLEEQRDVIQVTWSRLGLETYAPRPFYAPATLILDQIFSPVQKEMDASGNVQTDTLLKARLKLYVTLVLTKGMNHSYGSFDEDATRSLIRDILHLCGTGTRARDVISFDVAMAIAMITAMPLHYKSPTATDSMVFLRYLQRCEDLNDERDSALLDSTLSTLYAMLYRLSHDTEQNTDSKAAQRLLLSLINRGNRGSSDMLRFIVTWPLVGDINTYKNICENKINLFLRNETIGLVSPAFLRKSLVKSGTGTEFVSALLASTSHERPVFIVDDTVWDAVLVQECCREDNILDIPVPVLAYYVMITAFSDDCSAENKDRVTSLMSTLKQFVLHPTRKDFLSSFLLGCLLQSAGQYQQATDVFKTCLETRGDHIPSKIRLLLCRTTLNRREDEGRGIDYAMHNRLLSTMFSRGKVCSSHALTLHPQAPSGLLDLCLQALLLVDARERYCLLEYFRSQEDPLEPDQSLNVALLISMCRINSYIASHEAEERFASEITKHAQQCLAEAMRRFSLAPSMACLMYIDVYFQSQQPETRAKVSDLYQYCNVDVPSQGVDELVAFHPFEHSVLPEVVLKDCETSPVLLFPARQFMSLLLFHRVPILQLMSNTKDVSGILNNKSDQTVDEILTMKDEEREIHAQRLMVIGIILRLCGHIQEARETLQESVSAYPRHHENGYNHIRDCESMLVKSCLRKMTKGDFSAALEAYQEVWEAGLPLCRDTCSLGLHLSCQLHRLFYDAMAPKEQCVSFLRYMLHNSSLLISDSHREHMGVLLGCMLFDQLQSQEEDTSLKDELVRTFEAIIVGNPAGATLTVYANMLMRLDEKQSALIQLEKAIAKGKLDLPLHVSKHKQAIHQLITLTRFYPAHGFLESDELFELFASSGFYMHFDSYLVYAMYLRIAIKSDLGEGCLEDLLDFEAICDEIGHCTAKFALLGLASLHARQYTKAEQWFEAERKDVKNLFEKEDMLCTFIVVAHVLAMMEKRFPLEASKLCGKWLQHVRLQETEVHDVTRHAYITYKISSELNASPWLAMQLSMVPGMSEEGNVSFLGEMLYYAWGECQKRQRCALLANQLALLYYQEKYLKEGDHTKKVEYAATVGELFAYSFQESDVPSAFSRLQYASFLLQESQIQDAKMQAETAFAFITKTLTDLAKDENPGDPSEKERKKAFYLNKCLDQATSLVMQTRCMCGEFTLAAQAVLDGFRLRRKLEGSAIPLASEELAMLTNQAYNLCTNPGCDIQDGISLYRAVLQHNTDQTATDSDPNYKPILSSGVSNLACMLFAQAAQSQADGTAEKDTLAPLSEINALFEEAVSLCPLTLAARADYGNFLVYTGNYTKALDVLSVTVGDTEAASAMNGYSKQEYHCVDKNIQREIDNAVLSECFLIHSILYCLYLRVIAYHKLNTDAHGACLPEIEYSLQEMERLCEVGEVFAKPNSYRLLAAAALTVGCVAKAKTAARCALALMAPEDPMIPFCESLVLDNTE